MDDDEVTPLSVPTTNYGWAKPTVGGDDDAWGGMLNSDLDGIDSTVKSVSNVANAAYPASNPSGYQTAANVTAALPVASSTTPVMDGAAAIGVGTTWARADHVHPSDTSKLPLTGGVLSGALTPAQVAGVVGTTTNNNAAAGSIGEFITTTVGGVSTPNNTAVAVASISLTAGDWDVWGNVYFAGGTAYTNIQACVNTAATLAAIPNTGGITGGSFNTATTMAAPMQRFLLAATTTVFLVGFAGFTGAGTAAGFIAARRAR